MFDSLKNTLLIRSVAIPQHEAIKHLVLAPRFAFVVCQGDRGRRSGDGVQSDVGRWMAGRSAS